MAAAALFVDGYTGHAKLVIDPGRRVLLGATFVGTAGGTQAEGTHYDDGAAYAGGTSDAG